VSSMLGVVRACCASSPLLLDHQPVAHLQFCQQMARLRRIVLELAAQIGHVHAQSPTAHREAETAKAHRG